MRLHTKRTSPKRSSDDSLGASNELKETERRRSMALSVLGCEQPDREAGSASSLSPMAMSERPAQPKSMLTPRPTECCPSLSFGLADRSIVCIAGVRGEISGEDSVLDAAETLRERGGVWGRPSMMESEANGDASELGCSISLWAHRVYNITRHNTTNERTGVREERVSIGVFS